MNLPNPERKMHPETRINEEVGFTEKFKDLLPGIDFEESTEILEARTAIIEALTADNHDADLLYAVWSEYADLCEQIIDGMADTDSPLRAQRQIATIVHKALIFREAGNRHRYGEELRDAEDYAYNMRLDTVATAITIELDNLAD